MTSVKKPSEQIQEFYDILDLGEVYGVRVTGMFNNNNCGKFILTHTMNQLNLVNVLYEKADIITSVRIVIIDDDVKSGFKNDYIDITSMINYEKEKKKEKDINKKIKNLDNRVEFIKKLESNTNITHDESVKLKIIDILKKWEKLFECELCHVDTIEADERSDMVSYALHGFNENDYADGEEKINFGGIGPLWFKETYQLQDKMRSNDYLTIVNDPFEEALCDAYGIPTN